MIKALCRQMLAMAGLIRPLVATLSTGTLLLGVIGCGYLPTLKQEKPKGVEPVQAEAPKPELPMEAQEVRPAKGTRWEWKGDKRKISHIWIDVDSQKARFYDGKEQVGWTYVASGLKTHPTPVGQFTVMGKEKTKESNLYGKIYNAEGRVVVSDAKRGRNPVPAGGRFAGAKMPNYLRLTGDGVGLHAGPIPRPGHPASHGCIRLPAPMAERLFSQVSIGTPVTITGSGPDYGDYRAKLAAQGPGRQEPAEGGPMEAAEVAKVQITPSASVQNPPAQTQPVQTQPLSPRPAPIQAPRTTGPIPTEPVKALRTPGPTPTEPVQTVRTTEPVPAEPVQARSAQIQATQPQSSQPRLDQPRAPQNQTWKPLIIERNLAVPVEIQPTNQAKQPAVMQPSAPLAEGNPAVKTVQSQQRENQSIQTQATMASPQVTKEPAASSSSQVAGDQVSPHQVQGASAQEPAGRSIPTAASPSGAPTAVVRALPDPGGIPNPPPPTAGQLQAKPAPAAQTQDVGTKVPDSIPVKIPQGRSAPLGQDQAQSEPAPTVPPKTESGKSAGG